MKYGSAFFAALIVLAVLDVVWLKLVMGEIFKSELGDIALQTPRMIPATIFYLMYAIGIVVFVVSPNASSAWTTTLLSGALFGLIAYGTYDLTNMATLKAWTWKLASLDIAWGAFATAIGALAGRAAFAYTPISKFS
jgi:uncharacterized membrane protein